MRNVCTLILLLVPALPAAAQQARQLPQPDERYKADVLLVVAHPDDEGAATPYLARAIDEGKRVAVVYATRGSSGANEVGSEQAGALGEIREIEARRANAFLGITNVWFLDGKDTASQNVLQSLANWGHGQSLQELVQLVRLTRPEVILTFLPGTFVGEDHGDHQAAGVLATEAFDLAGDPTVFPEQVAGPTRRLEVFLENLRPWQAKKIYYFADADREDIFRGLGPEYPVTDISKSSRHAYWRMALDSFRLHETQAKSFIDSIANMSDAQLEKLATSNWGDVQHFVRGRSLVGGSLTGDIFDGITPDAVAFAPPARAPRSEPPTPFAELGGPWTFYDDFRRAHGLQTLPHPEPPEMALEYGSTLVVPVWLHNPIAAPQKITLSVVLPTGWTAQSGAETLRVGPKQVASARVEIALPAAPSDGKKKELQEVTINAESEGKSIGVIRIRVELRKRALPE
jgi:LmbE family N-acetylglucosaminyl deacetylase